RRDAARPGDGGAERAEGGVPARHLRGRQPAPAALSAPPGRAGAHGLPPRRPRPLLRLLHRQLPGPAAREDPEAGRPAQLAPRRPLSMGRKLALAVISPGGRKRVYQALAGELAAVEPPVWAGLMAEFVRRKGYSVAIVDADAENIDAEETARRVEALD